jgi:SAM-dependent methyltransferase
MSDQSRAGEREILHGRLLAAGDPEETWGWGSPAGQARASRRAALIAHAAGLGPGVRTLEIGCGTGLFTVHFVRTGAQVVAVEISADLLDRARARAELRRVQFLEGQFERVGVRGPFDAVIGSSVLHHMDLAIALPRIHALLAPGGAVCFAEPNLLNPQVCLERRFRRWFPYVSPDETAFVRWPLKRLLENAGFREVCITPFDWLHPATPSRLITGVSRLGRLFERIPGLRESAGSLLIRCTREGETGSPPSRTEGGR